MVGLISLIAAVTFVIELRARSVRRGIGVGSIVLGGLGLALTRTGIIQLLNAGSEFEVRYTLWQEM